MDGILALAGIVRPRVPLLRAINLVLKRPIVATHAVGARIDGRFLFVVPWQGRSILGTAYAPPDQPLADQTTAFLAAAARAYPWAELQPDDVALVHRGLVPGTDGGSGLWTRSQLVDHEADGAPGLVSALAVKYTTARALAEKAVDLVLRRLGRASVPSRTATTPLPEARLLEGTIEERTRHAVRVEMALTLADAVLRRTDLGSAGPPAEDVATTVLSTMAAELSWDAARQAAERRSLLAAYRA
jgi:glycerol-3-phosphate dehydrogenase